MTKAASSPQKLRAFAGYTNICGGIVEIVNAARVAAARNVNALMTASYWEIGRRIVEAEQKGKRRAGYGEQLIARLSSCLGQQIGRGFSSRNLEQMRQFYLTLSILQTLSAELNSDEASTNQSRKFRLAELAQVFTLPWSAYLRLLSVKNEYVCQFYEVKALRVG